MKRVMIFVDNSNFFVSIKSANSGNNSDQPMHFDWSAFVTKLSGEDDLIRTYLAGSYRDDKDRARNFFNSVDRQPQIYMKEFKRRDEREKQVDVYLATQLVALAYENAYDIAYLVSGDEDFVPAIEIVQQKGKIVVAVSFGKALSDEIARKADWVISMDEGDPAMNPMHWRNFVRDSGRV